MDFELPTYYLDANGKQVIIDENTKVTLGKNGFALLKLLIVESRPLGPQEIDSALMAQEINLPAGAVAEVFSRVRISIGEGDLPKDQGHLIITADERPAKGKKWLYSTRAFELRA